MLNNVAKSIGRRLMGSRFSASGGHSFEVEMMSEGGTKIQAHSECVPV